MKERPILFSGAMVHAILSGAKTQTRRIVRVPPAADLWNTGLPVDARCPYGVAGDRLWVRETFAQPHPPAVYYRADGPPEGYSDDGTWRPSIFMPRALSRISLDVLAVRAERLQDIVDADIAAEGVNTQSALDLLGPVDREIVRSGGLIRCPRDAWRIGWDSINGKRAPWASNPWVWVIGFRRVSP